MVGGTLSAKNDGDGDASSTWSGSGAMPTETGGAMGSVRPEWLGIAAGVAAWLI